MPTPDGDRNRRRPKQVRSERTYEALLTAASDLLATAGLESFTTNAVARRAGVSITALYRYFPDKYAIMAELYRRSEERRAAAVAPYIERAARGGDWVTVMRESTMAAARARVADPEHMALRPIHSAIPELREADRAIIDASTARVSAILRHLNPRLTPARAQRAARLVSETLSAALDEATVDGRVKRAYLDDALHMVELYVRDLVGDKR